MVKIQRGANCGCAVGEVVISHKILVQPLKKQQRLIHFNSIRIDRNHQMPGVKKGRAIVVHELHQREQNGAARFPELRVHRECRHLGDIAFVPAYLAQIKNRLQRKTKQALPNQ